MSNTKTILLDERASDATQKIYALTPEEATEDEIQAIIKREFADVVETDPQVRELVSAARQAESVIRAILYAEWGTSVGESRLERERHNLTDALKAFEKA